MIKGDRVFLRALEREDLPKLRDWRNDPSVRVWCREFMELNMSNQEAWFAKINADPSVKMFAVCSSATDKGIYASDLIGVCGLTSIDPLCQDAEFSLYIAPDFQRHGYGRDALKTLLEWGFLQANLNRIWGESFEGNPAIPMFMSLGFCIEGFHRSGYFKSGRHVNYYTIALLKEEFKHA
ncbi:MAG TPA: GNAT family N-acetyltransferase [Candidatus Omnitrophota bacterium]|nr:GNAT family N-acetyltransferase [Candidatus Omnitrophota bacterium]